MATSSNYFIDSTTFITATAVFINTELSLLAPDGFYSFGTTVRQQSGGILLTPQTCSDCNLPVTGLNWATTVNNPCDATPWVITNQNLRIRYNVTDSAGLCGGTCSSTQSGTATATITVGAVDVNMGLSFTGIGEREAAAYEKILFRLDGVQVANANAPGGGLGCAMGAVVQTFTTPPPYLLLAGSVHTLFIDFTTADALYHVNSFYEVDLTFTEIP